MKGKRKPRWRKRDECNLIYDAYEEPEYDREGFFTVVLHCNGYFGFEHDETSDKWEKVYLNGRIICFDYWDIDHMTKEEVLKMMNMAVSAPGEKLLSYKKHGKDLEKGLEKLKTNDDFTRLVGHIKETKCTLICFYAENGGSSVDLTVENRVMRWEETGETVLDSKENVCRIETEPNVEPISVEPTEITQPNIDLFGDTPSIPTDNPAEWAFNDLLHSFPLSAEDHVSTLNQSNVEFQWAEPPQHSGANAEGDETENDSVDARFRPGVETTQEGVTVETIPSEENEVGDEDGVDAGEEEAVDGDDEEDGEEVLPDYSIFPDNDYDFVEESWPEDVAPNLDIPEQQIPVPNVEEVDPNEPVYGCAEPEPPAPSIRVGNVEPEGEVEDNLNPEDELLSIASSDDEEVRVRDTRIRDFIPDKEMRDPSFHIGKKFASTAQAKEAVERYGVKQRRKIQILHKCPKKLRARCLGNNACPWYIFVSKDGKSNDFLVKTYVAQHNCGTYFVHPKASYHYICELYLEKFRVNPGMPVKALQNLVRIEQQLQITYNVAYRAKEKAMRIINGDGVEQFRQMFRYASEVINTHPGTSFIIQRDDHNNFKRAYICLGPLKEGMKSCRKMIGLDGCFLKGVYRGQLLSAVGIDANDCIYPLAWGIVETETRASWQWFMARLREDLGIDADESFRWTFMSDMSKGLESALVDVFPNSEHRYCVYHIYNRYKREFRGKELKDMLWKCATATYESKFGKFMDELKARDAGAWNYLVEKGADHWSRSKFGIEAKCDLLLNNICECWNASIKEARDKPPITMLETIRCRVMKRIYLRRDEMRKKSEGMLLCFKIQEKLERNKDDSRYGEANWNGGDQYGINCHNNGEQHVVDLRRRRCSCRKWDLTGIPCFHAISAIYMDSQNNRSNKLPEDWVDPCYHTTTFLNTYDNLLNPIRDPDQWPTNDAICIPPEIQNKKGRRNTKRRRGVLEEVPNPTRLSRVGSIIHCRRCGGKGHNIKSCQNMTLPVPGQRRGRGRPINPNSARQRSGNAPSLAGRGRTPGNMWRASVPRRVREGGQPTTSGAGTSAGTNTPA